MTRKMLFCVPFCFTALFAGQSLYLSDFHYLQNQQEKKILQDSEISHNVYRALDRLTSQNANGIIPLKNSNFVAIYTTKQNVLHTASELIKLGYNNFIFAKDEFGRYLLILRYYEIEQTRAVSRKLLNYGFNAQGFINNQRTFYYEQYYNNCQQCQNLVKKQTSKVTSKKKVQKKVAKKPNNVTKIEALPTECSIVEKMRDKTFYNPKTNVFVIDGIEYNELPKEFIVCDAVFTDVTLTNGIDVKFTTEDNKTISGVLELPKEGILDDDFFWKPNNAYSSSIEANNILVKKEESKKVICDFSLPYGIRTSLDADGKIIKLPQTYVGNSVELLYYIDGDRVKLSNSTYANISILKSKFDKHCKMVD